MAKFVSIPATVVPFSAKTPEQGIEWAKEYVDRIQKAYPDDTYVTAVYDNLKANQTGQILSTKYAELVQQAFKLDTVQRVFLKTVVTADEFNSVVNNNTTTNQTTITVQDVIAELDLSQFESMIDERLSALGVKEQPDVLTEIERLTARIAQLERTPTTVIVQEGSTEDIVSRLGFVVTMTTPRPSAITGKTQFIGNWRVQGVMQ